MGVAGTGVFHYLLSVRLTPLFYILLCDFGAETLQIIFPSLPCQLPVGSVNGKP